VFRENTNAGNGLTFNRHGNLLTCEGGKSSVTMFDMRIGDVTVLASEYDGKPLNAPNDLILDRKGGMYFSDPAFGQMKQDSEAVYYLPPDGELVRIWEGIVRPNGVVLSFDESILYVSSTFDKLVWALELGDDGLVKKGGPWAELEITGKPVLAGGDGVHVPLEGYPDASVADGMAIDVEGSLYVTTQLGVQVIDRDGNYIGTIDVPEQPANCAFGGSDMKTLFITATSGVYKIDLNVPGVYFPQTG
jgi:gluconolactonase